MRFASFMNQLPGFAWIKDLEGRYVYANSALQKLGKYRDGWLGKTDLEFWPKEIAETYRGNDQQVIALGKPLETIEPFVMPRGKPSAGQQIACVNLYWQNTARSDNLLVFGGYYATPFPVSNNHFTNYEFSFERTNSGYCQ